MRSLVLIGGGGHCKSVLDTALRMNYFNEIVITDPYIPAGTMIMGCRVIGNDDMLKEVYSCGYELAFISIGSIKTTALRKKLWQKARDIGFRFPCITDPDAIISDDSHIDNGTYIGKRVVVNAGTYIGSNAIINTGAVIEHDCRIGDFTHVAPGACI